MTRNQIAYQQLLETKRANRAQERLKIAEQKETQRSNVAREDENYRHNTSVEQETLRHNQAVEDVSLKELGIKQEQVSVQAYDAETRRMAHSENVRHNVATEGIQSQQASAALTQAAASMRQAEVADTNAQVNLMNATTRQYEYLEDVRANQAREKENQRHNLAIERPIRQQTQLYAAQTSKTRRETEAITSNIVSNYANAATRVSGEVRNWVNTVSDIPLFTGSMASGFRGLR